MKLRVGFVGLGLMGNPMAKNILKKGFPLTVYNRTKEKTKELESFGAKVADSPMDLARQADVVITMVTAGKDVENVLFGEKGVVKSVKKDLIAIDMSTIGKIAAVAIAKKLSLYGIDFLDAPVTGSTPKAISGELTIFVGGKKEVFTKAHAVLSPMGTKIIHMGETGSGQAMKLINNYVVAAQLAALSEGMLLADYLHLSREKVSEAFLQTPNLSPTEHMKMPNYIKNEFPLLFSLANMRKDLGLALLEMQKAGKNLPGVEEIEHLYGKANNNPRLSGEDFSIVIKELEKSSS